MNKLVPNYDLEDCIELNKTYIDTFEIPTLEEIDNLKVGDAVLLIFSQKNGQRERMWVEIENISKDDEVFSGKLLNTPLLITSLKVGDKIEFEYRHIADFQTKADHEKILEEYQETGKIPGVVTFHEVRDNIQDLLSNINTDEGFSETHSFISEQIGILNSEMEEAKESVEDQFLLQLSMARLFLYTIFVYVIPEVFWSKLVQRPELGSVLTNSKEIFSKIADNYAPLLKDFRDKFSVSVEASEYSVEELPDYYLATIEQAIEKLSS